jgi:hypothetical protein
MQARKLELHVCDQSSDHDNLRTVNWHTLQLCDQSSEQDNMWTTDALHSCAVVEQRHVEITCEDTY